MKTILVVDDMAILREPIAATLRLKGYQVLTASNGQEALQVARQRTPDLIMLDVAMPVMDGLACLAELRSIPETAKTPVLMLTAMSEREVIVKAAQMGIAGFMLKTSYSTAQLLERVKALVGGPEAAGTTPPTSIEAVSEQSGAPAPAAEPSPKVSASTPAQCLANRLTKSEVFQRLTKEIELQSIKPVLEYVITLTRSSTSTVEDIASAIRQDQALALRVLRVANSSFYQRGRGAKNLMEATQRLGLTAVRNTVIAILAIEHFEQATESGLIPQRFWEHSLATAVLAEMIGEADSNANTDQLFLAGMLHDAGRLVLSSIYPKEYAAVIAHAEKLELELEAVEMQAFELSHVEATRHLLAQWNMAPSIIDAASSHELSIEKLRHVNQNARGILTVALANRLAHALVVGCSGNARLLPYHEFASELGLDHETIARITTAAIQKTKDTEMFYAAQSDRSFCDSVAVDLAKKTQTAPRIAVFGPDAPVDPFSLFFEQLGWLQPERPTLALLDARSQGDFTRFLPALKQLDAGRQKNIPLIVASRDRSTNLPLEWTHGRQTMTVPSPCAYARLIEAVVRCSSEKTPSVTAAIG